MSLGNVPPRLAVGPDPSLNGRHEHTDACTHGQPHARILFSAAAVTSAIAGSRLYAHAFAHAHARRHCVRLCLRSSLALESDASHLVVQVTVLIRQHDRPHRAERIVHAIRERVFFKKYTSRSMPTATAEGPVADPTVTERCLTETLPDGSPRDPCQLLGDRRRYAPKSSKKKKDRMDIYA